jgi:RimJ/RimL family protein N-acetyltransferase
VKKICIYEYDGIRLQPIEKDDIEEIRLLRNANKDFFFYSREITTDEQESWFEKYLKRKDDYTFKVVKTSNTYEIIGMVALYDFQPDLKQCEFGRIIINHNKVNEKGIGLKATKCACQIAFEQLGVDKIVLEVFADNIRAYKTYISAGFRETGRGYKKGSEAEIVCMEILRE